MSDQPGPSNPPKSNTQPKAIASLAKKQSDVTRLGAHKLKFVPTLPARRKKEYEEPTPASTSTERGRGRGRGDSRGRGRGRGTEGRGAAPRPPAVEMTASGPFAMGPTLAGSSARRTAPRANFTPVVPQGPGAAQRLGAGLSQTAAPALGVKREPNDLGSLAKGKGKGKTSDEDEGEVYSDPDEGVEILDMENVRMMDWMAPETLKKEKQTAKKVKKEEKAKVDLKGKGPTKLDQMEVEEEETESSKVNLANAVHLSDSEEEEEMEDIIDDFALNMNMDTDDDIQQERLYFFQFPHPLPTFLSKSEGTRESIVPEPSEGSAATPKAEDGKPADPTTPQTEGKLAAEPAKIDGVVGQLEIYRSGAVKMRLGNDILLDVTAATQPSFLQHAVYVDPEHKRICVLGEVNRRFVVSPDIDALLASMEQPEQPQPTELDADGLIRMDTS
ncbi:hypothetical protein EIP86_005607 [Pleurotus ostreatoroseus]|nr:hypothetical protein EIP86_005607 [Pleurotus ostreatoroseus]